MEPKTFFFSFQMSQSKQEKALGTNSAAPQKQCHQKSCVQKYISHPFSPIAEIWCVVTVRRTVGYMPKCAGVVAKIMYNLFSVD